MAARDRHGRFWVPEPVLEERRKRLIELRVKGYTYRRLSEELGISEAQVYNDLKAVLERTKADTEAVAENERRVSLERIEKAVEKLMPMLEETEPRGEHGDGDPLTLKAIDRLDKLEKRRAGLLGLDAPTRTEHEVQISQLPDREVVLEAVRQALAVPEWREIIRAELARYEAPLLTEGVEVDDDE